MPVNADKPHLWKEDLARSVDFYNDWFMSFAPEAYRKQREKQADVVEEAMEKTDYLRSITPDVLKSDPGILPMLRMTTAPPIARDRLIGLSYTTPNLVKSMEETRKHDPRVPPRMSEDQLQKELDQICEVLHEMVDRDICPWLGTDEVPTKRQLRRGPLFLLIDSVVLQQILSFATRKSGSSSASSSPGWRVEGTRRSPRPQFRASGR